mgnify:CR=1 FL=1
MRTLLPIGESDPELGVVERQRTPPSGVSPSTSKGGVGYLFEPSAEEVLSTVVPNLVSIQVYQALLETAAAEHAARMFSMKNATENADELVDDLTLTLNQVRQQQITRELQEIVSGTMTNV